MNIYNVNEKYKAVLKMAEAQAEANGGEVEENLHHHLSLIEEDLDECLIGMMYDIKNIDGNIEMLKTVAGEIAQKSLA